MRLQKPLEHPVSRKYSIKLSGQQKVFNKVKEIVNKGSLTSLDKRPLIDISDKVQKLKVINRYLIQTIDYENNYKKLKDGGQTACSALIGRKTVCSGYAHAFSLLANASGVETYIVGGTGNATGKFEPHSWNISKLGNYYYSIDVTWNDSFNAETRWFLLGKRTSIRTTDRILQISRRQVQSLQKREPGLPPAILYTCRVCPRPINRRRFPTTAG